MPDPHLTPTPKEEAPGITLPPAASEGSKIYWQGPPTVTEAVQPGTSTSAARISSPTPGELQAMLPSGAYVVESMIGQGGMGAVYKGWQVSLERHVAIKVLKPDLGAGDEQFTTRFKREAKTMARLQHPGIVAVIDAGETACGLLYFVMEFIEGTDVSRLVKSKGRLSAEEALTITTHVCDALAFAHENGVIHRDIKPANIMVTTRGQVKVADFGIAKSTTIAGPGLTMSGMSIGTPDYIAPEAMTIGEEVDHRADIFAVGVMLYHMLTGDVPRGVFKMPSTRYGTDVRLDQVIAKAMQFDPEHRYQDAREVRQDLDALVTSPISRQSTRETEPPAEPPKRTSNVVRWIIIIAAALAVISLAGWMVWNGMPSLASAAASSAPPVVRLSNSSEPWVDCMDDLAAASPGARRDGTFLRFSKATEYSLGRLLKDGAIRILYLPPPVLSGAQTRLDLRKSPRGTCTLYTWGPPGEMSNLQVAVHEAGQASQYMIGGLIPHPVTGPFSGGRVVELQARLVGSELTVKVNGKTLGKREVQWPHEGSLGGLMAAGSLVYAVQTLDLTPSSAPSLPLPEITGWQDGMAKAKENFRRSGPVEIEEKDGWVIAKTASLVITVFTPKPLTDFAVRGKIRGQTNIAFRVDNKILGWYVLKVKSDGTGFVEDRGSHERLVSFRVRPDAEHDFLITMMGEVMNVWIDGTFVATARDKLYPSGHATVFAEEPGAAFRDLQFAELPKDLGIKSESR